MEKRILDGLLASMSPMEESSKYLKSIIYGDPGSMKTCLACAVGKKVIYVEADPGGWDSLENHDELNPSLHPGRYTLMKYEGISQLEALARAFEENIKPFSDHDLVVLDTASYMADLDLDIVIKQRAKHKGIDVIEFKDDDMWPAYRQNKDRIGTALLKLFKAPVNIIAIAHARELENKKTNITKIAPDFTPSVVKIIEGICKLIVHTSAKEIRQGYQRQIQVHPTNTVIAKSHIGGLEPIIKIEDGDVLALKRIVDNWQNTGGKFRSEKDVYKELNEVGHKFEPKSIDELGSELL